jgi:hypothetical protein
MGYSIVFHPKLQKKGRGVNVSSGIGKVKCYNPIL